MHAVNHYGAVNKKEFFSKQTTWKNVNLKCDHNLGYYKWKNTTKLHSKVVDRFGENSINANG